jgi:two-component system chemotaxis response regulator CheY
MPSTKVVLVIDDDADIREAIRDLLATEGFGVAEARDGGAGLAYLRSNAAPGVILLDWNMTPVGGADFMTEFSRDANLAPIPVVLLTADARAEDKARVHGLSILLTKPIDVQRLLDLAGRYCGDGPTAPRPASSP